GPPPPSDQGDRVDRRVPRGGAARHGVLVPDVDGAAGPVGLRPVPLLAAELVVDGHALVAWAVWSGPPTGREARCRAATGLPSDTARRWHVGPEPALARRSGTGGVCPVRSVASGQDTPTAISEWSRTVGSARLRRRFSTGRRT